MSPLAALLAFAAAAAAAAPRHDFTRSDVPAAVAGADTAVPPHGCMEAGTVYAEGSPLVSDTECERCFCLGGRRRCVRPRCLGPPAGCDAAPTAGACCPQRYHCHHHNTTTPAVTTESAERSGECIVEGKRVAEGESVPGEKCTHCYCLRGAVLCQPDACARILLDCRPMLQPGHCCPHRYRCPTRTHKLAPALTDRSRALNALDQTTAPVTTTPTLTAVPVKSQEHTSSQNDAPIANDSLTDLIDTTTQPEGSVRVAVNGTVNCTAELAEAPLYGREDIITEAAFLEHDSFAVNVTSSLRTNSSRPDGPSALAARPSVSSSTSAHNEYDYDYNEATLPPSLPNLKIIPFVAADAVVQREERPPPLPADRRRADPSPAYAPPAPAPPAPPIERRRDDDLPMHHASPPPPPARHTTASLASGLFSPPAHVEGGFVPKGGGFDGDESGPPSPPAPLAALATRNPIDLLGGRIVLDFGNRFRTVNIIMYNIRQQTHIHNHTSLFEGSSTCTSADGEIVQNGASIAVMCEECTCVRGHLRCGRRPCRAPPSCGRLSPSKPTLALLNVSLDTYCCGELVCGRETDDTTTDVSVEKGTGELPPQTNETGLVAAELMPHSTVPTISRATNLPPSAITTTTQSTKVERNATTSPPLSTTPQRHDTTEPDRVLPDYTEEEEDEGFSFGNVLQLLLSDSYATTSATTPTQRQAVSHTAPATSPPARPDATRTTVMDPPTPISNRIDHLLLGESTSIRKTTPRSTTVRSPPPPAPDAASPAPTTGGGLLSKLAGCNIYGRMYRVGRIIAELSSACAECRCTELGVQCRALRC